MSTIIETTPISGGAPAGYYAKQVDLYRRAGVDNLRKMTDLNSLGVEDLQNEQAALDHADKLIDYRLNRAGVVTPVPMSHRAFSMLTEIASLIAIVYQYESRGWEDLKPETSAGKMQKCRERADALLRSLCMPGAMTTVAIAGEPRFPKTAVR